MYRDREARDIIAKLENLTAADVGLMFGRIDVEDAEPENPVPGDENLDRRYIGRIGLHDSDELMRTLLMDWRAPMARPFYLATTLHPEGVHTRRHIHTRGRTVVDSSDEQLMGGETSAKLDSGVGKESALLEAVTRARTPHMRDIVETIAAEQDAIIRSEHRGVTVVQGSPGTGKTAVALHRAAYLLYTWREQLEKTGVLIIGPNDRFLEYISHVLPSLGETGVVLATPGSLNPDYPTIPELDPLSREVKGSSEMVTILANAVKTWQTVPDSPREFVIDGVPVTLTPTMVRAARTRARRSRKPHNQARPYFLDHALNSLAKSIAASIGTDPVSGENLLSDTDRRELRSDLGEEETVLQALDAFWPELTPEKVLRHLLESPEAAASDYDEDTLDGLRRQPSENGGDPAPWTDADAPLLDELMELLGIVDDEEAARADRQAWLDKITEAQEALDILTGSASQDLDDGFAPEVLMAYDILDAETLADRQRVRDSRSTAERAKSDPRWAFGHVIVDEAQELSHMAWRMIFRRSPNRWMTIVGDPAQTGSPAGVDEWAETLEPFVHDRWQLHELTVNYRTPEDIAEIANLLLPDLAPDQKPAIALRASGTGIREAQWKDLASSVEDALHAARDGLVGVIGTEDDLARGLELTRAHLAESSAGSAEEPRLSCPDNLIFADLRSAKGLEFDEVVLLEPAHMVDATTQGLNDVYVALTRATQGLTVVHDDPVPWG